MVEFEGKAKEVIEKTEVVCIGTCGKDGPHLVATWGDYIRTIGIQDPGTIVIPAGGYLKTEENLSTNARVEVIIASKEVEGTHSMGKGFLFSGRGEIQESGELADLAKSKYSWARGALVIYVEEIKGLL
jgi:predicted pyridoxine 5'-phosphate oxidase superfamily flavin-nucleotide-binding protein